MAVAIERAERLPHIKAPKLEPEKAPIRADRIAQLREVLAFIAQKKGVPLENLTSRSRKKEIVKGKREVFEEFFAWVYGVPLPESSQKEKATALRISPSRVSVYSRKVRILARQSMDLPMNQMNRVPQH